MGIGTMSLVPIKAVRIWRSIRSGADRAVRETKPYGLNFPSVGAGPIPRMGAMAVPDFVCTLVFSARAACRLTI